MCVCACVGESGEKVDPADVRVMLEARVPSDELGSNDRENEAHHNAHHHHIPPQQFADRAIHAVLEGTSSWRKRIRWATR